jgi:KDPG and KHG aldolase
MPTQNRDLTVDAVTDQIAGIGLLPVIVIDDLTQARPLAQALVDSGLHTAEVTFRTPQAFEALSVFAGQPEMLVGDGTVRTAEQVRRARDAGARFVVSPGFSEPVVEACRALEVVPRGVLGDRHPPGHRGQPRRSEVLSRGGLRWASGDRHPRGAVPGRPVHPDGRRRTAEPGRLRLPECGVLRRRELDGSPRRDAGGGLAPGHRTVPERCRPDRAPPQQRQLIMREGSPRSLTALLGR